MKAHGRHPESMHETPRKHPEAARRHRGGTREAPRRHPEAPRRHPGGSQETPRTHPGHTQEAPRGHPRPRSTQEAPADTQGTGGVFEMTCFKTIVFYN